MYYGYWLFVSFMDEPFAEFSVFCHNSYMGTFPTHFFVKGTPHLNLDLLVLNQVSGVPSSDSHLEHTDFG